MTLPHGSGSLTIPFPSHNKQTTPSVKDKTKLPPIMTLSKQLRLAFSNSVHLWTKTHANVVNVTSNVLAWLPLFFQLITKSMCFNISHLRLARNRFISLFE